MRIIELTQDTKRDLLGTLLKRSPNNYGSYEAAVADIVNDVRARGDEALCAYTERFDHCLLTKDTMRVTKDEMEEAYAQVDDEFIRVMKASAANIRAYHEKQLRTSWFDAKPDGTILGQRILPLATAGIYVPGGKAAYPSSLLMNAVTARVAGVERILICTPPGKDGKVVPATLVAADICGIDEIYKCGGAQAIAAMAFGTDTIPKVEKITGPGNIFVALAKKAVFGYVSIDSIAGPSEILVLADESANPRYIAADLLSQAEHDEIVSSLLLSTDITPAESVSAEVDAYTQTLSRKESIQKSLHDHA